MRIASQLAWRSLASRPSRSFTAALGVAFVNDPGRLPTRSGTGDMLERLSVPHGSPCAALAHPRARATVQGHKLRVSGYLVSLTGIDSARVRLVHRTTGDVAEGTAQIGLSEPTPRHDTISKFPDAHRSGFETFLDLADFPGGDAYIELWLPVSEASSAPLVVRCALPASSASLSVCSPER